MSDYQITCIVSDGSDDDRKIDAVGGPFCGGLSLEDAIRWIKMGHSFWTLANGNRADVFVRGDWYSGEFLTTSPDGYLPNNLLKLPPCL